MLARDAPPGFGEDDLLAAAAALESRSEHPLAREIVGAAAARGLTLPAMEDFVALPGRGVHARLGGYEVWIGSDRLYREHGEQIPDDLVAAKARLEAEGKSALILHREIERHERPRRARARRRLARPDRRDGHGAREGAGDDRGAAPLGMQRTVMLTGDNAEVARVVAAKVGIDEYHAEPAAGGEGRGHRPAQGASTAR